MAQVRLILTTIVLTVLIWALADQLQQEKVDIPVSLQLVPELGGDMSVVRVDGGRNPVIVRLDGRRRNLSKYLTGGPVPVSITIKNRPSGIHEINLLEALSNTLKGVEIDRVEPERISVEIDHRVTVKVPVRIETGLLHFLRTPVTEPSRVDVSLFEKVWESIPDSLRVLYVNADDYSHMIPKDEPFEIMVPVTAELNDHPVTVRPREVLLKGQLQENPIRVIKGVPIRFAANQEVFNQYRIDRPDNSLLLIQSITVRGPEHVLDQIESKEIMISGFITLTSEYAVPTEEFRRLLPVFNLPDGVELVEDPSEVQFRLQAIPSASSDNDSGGK